MDELRITLIQTDIAWERKRENLRRLHAVVESLQGKTDLAIVPETFSTGFSMSGGELAEPVTGETAGTLRRWAEHYGMALAGSFLSAEEGKCFNRAFFLTPEGEAHFYDKRHLFRMGYEPGRVSAGSRRVIVPYRGWNIMMQVCYDLRFPVWCRNVGNDYDLMICVANWPASRRRVWDTLLEARAVENISYVCGVNRIGSDGHGLPHNGGSALYSPRGDRLASVPDNAEGTATAAIRLSAVREMREKFPAWMDADRFEIINY